MLCYVWFLPVMQTAKEKNGEQPKICCQRLGGEAPQTPHFVVQTHFRYINIKALRVTKANGNKQFASGFDNSIESALAETRNLPHLPSSNVNICLDSVVLRGGASLK